ncbi:PilW family protein [Pseudomonas sp. MWU13-2105]|uniref:PilW family protein n=1 Tax=Pseudomonas sp. MWU13-2105 TaxID=2935074 RepID=UPI00200F0AF3|nr:prepilin-type N-terminal cleavage/methylation domain-containing protein [Pseudomonas sp. MWU13-2105]
MSRDQRGFTLISLMVGTVISLLSILAMLSLYKNLVYISATSIQSARQDGQVASALLTAQRELTNGGFWSGSATARASSDIDNYFVLLSGATLTNGTLAGTATAQANFPTLTSAAPNGITGNAIVWSYQTNATATTASCAGLAVINGALVSLKGAAGCTQASTQWNTTTWTSTTLIEAGQSATLFSVGFAACWPYGRTTDSSNTAYRLQVSLSANNSTLDPNSSSPQPAYVKSKATACLINFEKPTS